MKSNFHVYLLSSFYIRGCGFGEGCSHFFCVAGFDGSCCYQQFRQTPRAYMNAKAEAPRMAASDSLSAE